jgi:hypothetical protein
MLSTTSPLTLIADIPGDMDFRCNGQLPDSCAAALGALFDHLIGACEQCGRNRGTERLRSIEVDNELESGGLFNCQF